jgi:hypothetical protein
VLHDDVTRCQLIAVTHVSDLQSNQIATPELAIDAQVEERKFTHSVFHLHRDPDGTSCPDYSSHLLGLGAG